MLLFIITVIIIKLLSDHKPNLKETILVVATALVWVLACAAFITAFIILSQKPR